MKNAQAARRAFEAWIHAVDYTTMPSQWKDGGNYEPNYRLLDHGKD